MATFKLTINDVKTHPENFLYIFATDEFLDYMGGMAKRIITQKRANQRKILILSAKNAGLTETDYTDAIRQGFIDIYGLKPAEILVKLAQGETVCGKNWKGGVYGVGDTGVGALTFKQTTTGGATVSVDENTGKILMNGYDIKATPIVQSGCPDNIGGYSYTDEAGNTYSSAYRKVTKKYAASTFTNKEGQAFTSSGVQKLSTESGNIWETILGFLTNFVNWLISLFADNKDTSNLITGKNSAPNQGDGFVQEAGFGNMGIILLGAVAAGTLLYGGDLFKGGKKKK